MIVYGKQSASRISASCPTDDWRRAMSHVLQAGLHARCLGGKFEAMIDGRIAQARPLPRSGPFSHQQSVSGSLGGGVSLKHALYLITSTGPPAVRARYCIEVATQASLHITHFACDAISLTPGRPPPLKER